MRTGPARRGGAAPWAARRSPALRLMAPISMERTSPRRGWLSRSGSMPPRISTRRRTATGSCASKLFLACALFINLPEARMRGVLLASIAFALVGSSLAAQDRKGIRFWNLTLYTITSFLMSPAGKDSWGPDQCKNDRDGTVDHDERLRITGIEPGRYDVKLADKIGRVCIVRNVEVKDGAVFSIEERQLTDCRR